MQLSGSGSSGHKAIHNEDKLHENSPRSLPYGGSLQEAIKQQDREAVKYLMGLREQNLQNNSNGNDHNESKKDGGESSVQECLLSLGFSQIQIHEYFTHDLTEAEALKTILDSERHFPNTALKKISNKINTTTSGSAGSGHEPSQLQPHYCEDHQVTPQMIRGLDPESTWTLLQCCVNNPLVSQLQVYELLTQLNSLNAVHLISPSAGNWLRSVLIKGYVSEVKCILFNLYLLLQSDSTSLHVPPIDQSNPDQLLMSYMCPITREILVEPVTLQVSEFPPPFFHPLLHRH
jgi:hypothetical protein